MSVCVVLTKYKHVDGLQHISTAKVESIRIGNVLYTAFREFPGHHDVLNFVDVVFIVENRSLCN